MKPLRPLTRVLIFSGIFALFVSQASARIIQAIDVSLSAVSSAIAAARDGDTVLIPPGVASWTAPLTITKAITLKGAGIGQTIIIDSLPANAPNPQSLIILNVKASTQTRLTGIEFDQDPAGRTTNFGQGIIQVNGTTSLFRMDNVKWNDVRNRCVYFTGAVYGVVDHWVYTGHVYGTPFYIAHHNIPGPNGLPGSFGDGSWATPTALGSANFLFFEDGTATNTAVSGAPALTDGNGGSRIVVRYCTITKLHVEAHGSGSTGPSRGLRALEVYGNTFNFTGGTAQATFSRGGTGVIWDNTVTGANPNSVFTFINYRSNEYIWVIASRSDGSDGLSVFDLNDTSDQTGNGYNGSTGGVWATGTAQTGSTGTTLVISGSGSQNWKGFVVRNLSQTYAAGGQTYNTMATIQANTGNTLHAGSAPHPYARQSWSVGDQYEIRKVLFSLDAPGAGVGDYLGNRNGSTGYPNNPRWLHQESEPYYLWNNTLNGSHGGFSQGSGGGEINSFMTSFVDNGTTPKPGYRPYRYPHRLVSGGHGHDKPFDASSPSPTPKAR